MIEPGAIITATGLMASLLAPACLIYSILNLRRDATKARWPTIVLGGLAVVQSVAAIIYFALLLHLMSLSGLGL